MTHFFKGTWFYIGLIVVLTIPLCLNLFSSHLINGHDSTAGLIRALSMNRYMGHGQFLVRWAPDINWGYGYPMFNFYPPFFSFISVIIFQFTQNMILAMNWASILFWTLSGIGMFLWAREFWGDEGGMLSAVFYIYAPYHIIDLYVRGAFAEFSSFAFFPFFLLSILKISQKVTLKYFLLGVGCVVGLSLTHNIMSMLFFPVATVFALYLFFFEKKSNWILTVAGMLILGLMISSFFWLPALVEKKFLNLNFLISMRYDFHKNFITIGQIFSTSTKGMSDNIPFQIGVIHSLICLVTVGCVYKIFTIKKSLGRTYLFFLIVGAAAIFFTLSSSHWCWEHISILRFIQFPWRFLAIVVFTISFLGGSVAILIKNSTLRKSFLIILGLLVIVISLKSFPKVTYVDNAPSIENFLALGEGEYTPKWIVVPPAKPPDAKFEIAYGAGRLSEEKSLGPVQYKTQFEALQPSLLCFHTFYFPGWKVYIDSQLTPPYTDNPFGLILFAIKPGHHDIQVIFGSTPIRTIAMIISWVGAILLLGILLFSRKLNAI